MSSQTGGNGKTARRIEATIAEMRPRRGRESSAHGATLSAALNDADRSGWLDVEPMQTLTLRAPAALIDAAIQASGVTSTEDLGILGLVLLAQPDPVAAFFRTTRGRLGEDHQIAD